MEEIKRAVKAVVKDLFNVDIEPELTRPDEQFGDYSTNVSMQIAAKIDDNPRKIAEAIANKLKKNPDIADVDVAGPGFINIQLSDEALAKLAFEQKISQPLKDNEILVEFGDPNPFKEMHIGHLYSYIVGDSICRLLENSGATVRRLSYHGDVGLHVAKAIWGMYKAGVKPGQHTSSIGEYYQKGAAAYGEDQQAKSEIDQINEHVYKKDESEVNELYDWGKEVSFEEFDAVIQALGIKTDKRYLESESAEIGVKFVKDHVGKVFKESEGAVVYEGEKVGLHTRVFITGKGLPTYESKDLGLAELKDQDFPDANRSVIITAHEQSEYFKVMLAALAEVDKDLAKKTTHLAHGFLSLSTGKMSSRKGDVFTANRLITDVDSALKQKYPEATDDTTLAGIKYGFLKHRLGSDIVYDVEESISLQGNSGPYLQYAYARARNILSKANAGEVKDSQFEKGERSLVRKIGEYPEVIARAVDELMPHHVANYLYDLAQTFNRFYENNRVINDPREQIRLKLVEAYATVLKNGLELLGINAPEKM